VLGYVPLDFGYLFLFFVFLDLQLYARESFRVENDTGLALVVFVAYDDVQVMGTSSTSNFSAEARPSLVGAFSLPAHGARSIHAKWQTNTS